MFGLFKKRKQSIPSVDELTEKMDIATITLRDKWIVFNQQLSFKSDVPLSKIIESFTVPAREYVISAHPVFSNAPNQVIWMMVFRAVMESGTHSKELVNDAVAKLEAKHAS